MDKPTEPAVETVTAGHLRPWEIGELPPAPGGGWRMWAALIGPGVLLAGASIGSGEWLTGPGVTAQYGGTLLWIAAVSIVCQVFCNLEMMRYTLWCGEPIPVGYFRTWPGPKAWVGAYLLLDASSIWPFNASNAAVPLAAAILGHLPGERALQLWGLDLPATLAGQPLTEALFTKLLGFGIFLLAFVPLIFGGTIYKMLERVMMIKLIVVLVYLVLVAAFLVHAATAREVLAGFFRFGQVPLRAQTVIAGRHFTYSEREPGPDGLLYAVKGTVENDAPAILEFRVTDPAGKARVFKKADEVPANLLPRREQMGAAAAALAQPGRFQVAVLQPERTLTVSGGVLPNGTWGAQEFVVEEAGRRDRFATLDQVPEPHRDRFRELVHYQGLELTSLWAYSRTRENRPPLDWALLATLAAIAGAGGMTNTLFSNFARDKGWGMGARVGAIPSAIGGRNIKLSHVGQVFRLNDENRRRWRGWMRHIVRDQLGIWMLCSVIGMALPCMMSLEFIRHAPVAGDRLAAMTADGMAQRFPEYRTLVWFVTLFVGFMVLAPGQILAGDQIARRWADISWSSLPALRKLGGNQVKYVYYGILAAYCVWGLISLTYFDPLQILKIAGVLMNIALGATALHALYVNRTLLPRELRPAWFMQVGALACGVFFLSVSAISISVLIAEWRG
jgi:hypothetical protein